MINKLFQECLDDLYPYKNNDIVGVEICKSFYRIAQVEKIIDNNNDRYAKVQFLDEGGLAQKTEIINIDKLCNIKDVNRDNIAYRTA